VPIRVSSSIDISATPQLVWAAFTDVHRWSEWNPAIIEVTNITGGSLWVPGGAFVTRYRGEFTPIIATTRSFVRQVVPGKRIVLAGEMLGSQGTLTYEFSPVGPKTVVSATEIFAQTDSDYRNYVISSATKRLLTLLLRALKQYVEGIGHKVH
jgi:uncharacterized protein YndB with AHSA1/START domain